MNFLGFSTYKFMLFVNKYDSISSISGWMAFIYFSSWLPWLDSLVQCWKEMVRADFLKIPNPKGKAFNFLPLRMMIFHRRVLLEWGCFLLFLICWWLLSSSVDFIKHLSYICWDGCMDFCPSLLNYLFLPWSLPFFVLWASFVRCICL